MASIAKLNRCPMQGVVALCWRLNMTGKTKLTIFIAHEVTAKPDQRIGKIGPDGTKWCIANAKARIA